MCGIFGYICEEGADATNQCFKRGIYALRQLQNRGYDSAGTCCIVPSNNEDDSMLVSTKYATKTIDGVTHDSIDRLEGDDALYQNATVGIFHTRWATHGAKTDNNAHPHLDHTGRIALVHNGIIDNYRELKTELLERAIQFKSETDTEIIVNMVSVYYDELGHMEEAVMKTVSRLRGTWALVIINSEKPDNVYCARHGSPLLIGFGDKSIMITSEQPGFGRGVNNYISLNNQDITVIRRRENKIRLENIHNYTLKEITVQANELTPEPYDHWTIKEIHEQYDSSIRAISFGGRLLEDSVRLGGLEKHIEYFRTIEHLILLGCGTSLNAARHSVQYFRDLCDFKTVQALDGSEFSKYDIPRQEASTTCAIFLSQSGETKDLYRCLKICRNAEVAMTVGVVNTVDSLIAREVDCGCYLNAGREVGVASTKAFTSQVIVLSMISIYFAQIKQRKAKLRARYIESLRRLSQDIRMVVESVEDKAREIASYLNDQRSMFVLGKGSMIAVAEEGALKTKEIGYIHSEAYGGNALRHGPYALLVPGTPIVFVNPCDSMICSSGSTESAFALMNNTVEEVKSRDAKTIMITDTDHELSDKIDYLVTVPHNAHYQGVLCNIPMQLIAYYMSIDKGHDPDKPRNLSKCVSV